MKKIKSFFKNTIIKHGAIIAAFAFVFVTFAANSSCFIPYYEPEEPAGLGKFKKHNN